MKRAWLAIALLSASWLMGLNYYQEPNLWAWSCTIAAAVLLLCGVTTRLPSRLELVVCLALALPAIWIAPGIYRVIPALMIAGLALHVLPIPLRWTRRLGTAALIGGGVLLFQSLAMYAYEAAAAPSHELPAPLAHLLAGLARLMGADAAAGNNNNVELFTMRRTHPIGATWELLFDPVTLCFLVGGIVLIFSAAARPRGLAFLRFMLLVLAWLPLRVAMLFGLYLHRALLTDYDASLDLMSQFFSPWTHLAMLAAPVLLAWRFISKPDAEAHSEPGRPRPGLPVNVGSAVLSRLLPATAALAGVVLIILGLFWHPSGTRKKFSRIVVDEYHSKWEPSGRKYDTEWYGQESGYNYYCIFDYCSRYYDLSLLNTPIADQTLKPDDILIVKVPTVAYSSDETGRIEQFVKHGGSVMFIGEHTDVFYTGTHLNAVTEKFGFKYRFDCAFGIRSVFEELYEQPLLPHPIVQRMPPLDFEISCTIDTGKSVGVQALRGTGLKNAFADYHASNFYPQLDDYPDSRYGAFVQMWAMKHGEGRAVAFSDSTQFSNFSTFEPGKPEMMIGMLEWLNHRNTDKPLTLYAWIGGALVLASALVARRRLLLPVCAGLLGWACAVYAVRGMNRDALPEPPLLPDHPMTRVAIDRTYCDSILSKGGFIGGRPEGFGIFERWILRLGAFTYRASGDASGCHHRLAQKPTACCCLRCKCRRGGRLLHGLLWRHGSVAPRSDLGSARQKT